MTCTVIASVQPLSRIQLFVTPRTAARQASLSSTISWSLLMSIESMMPSSHLIFCSPLLLLFPSMFPSIRVFSNKLTLPIKGPKYWSFSFSISPFNEYSGLISFWIDWFDLLAVLGTQESSPVPQFKSISLLVSAFFIVQLLYPYMNTGKTMVLTIWTFVSKVMSLVFFFNTLSRFVIVFLPRSKCLLISCLQ